MIYTIHNKATKTWQDKQFIEAILVSPDGTEHKVSAWNKEFDGKDTIDTELTKNEKGFWVLPKIQRTKPSSWVKKDPLFVEDKRNENIKQNMKDKEESIAFFNARNTAILFVEKYVSNPGVSSPSEALEAVRRYTETFFKDWQHWSNEPFHDR